MLRGIKPSAPSPGIRNPYRILLRRSVPEPVLALLIFIMGVWLWDNHFGPAAAYDAETCHMAVVKVDRDLRLAGGAVGLPAPLRRAILVAAPQEALQNALDSLDLLARKQALDEEAAYALTVLKAVQDHQNPATYTVPGMRLPPPPNPGEIARRLEAGHGRWWDAAYLRGVAEAGGPVLLGTDVVADFAEKNHALVRKAAYSRGAVLVFALMGVGFIPRALRAARSAWSSRSRGYPGAWRPGLGLGVFLLAYLASTGFNLALERVIRGPGDGSTPVILGMPVLLALDTAARLLPALVALGLLFRRGNHAITRLGLRKMPDFGLVLGMFALLTALDRLLRPTLGALMPPDPAGGLSSLEAGGWGLAFTAVSACLAAPVTEEILYRGVLFQTLANRIRVPAATLISAAVFAVVHFYDAFGLVSVGLFGAACALGFRARGALTTAIALHIFYNSVIKFPEWIVYHAPL